METQISTLANGGVGYTTTNTDAMTADIIAACDAAAEDIKSGKIVVGTVPNR